MSYDYRDETPVWVRYAVCINHLSDKYIEVRIDMDEDGKFVLTRRWGRRPDKGGGQIVFDAHPTLAIATGLANAWMDFKLTKGYLASERPKTADTRVQKDLIEWFDQ